MTLREIEGALVDAVNGLDDLLDELQDDGAWAQAAAAEQAADDALAQVQRLLAALSQGSCA
jgi:hypothetical protein